MKHVTIRGACMTRILRFLRTLLSVACIASGLIVVMVTEPDDPIGLAGRSAPTAMVFLGEFVLGGALMMIGTWLIHKDSNQ